MLDLELTGKRALVTGASRGIGRAIAEGLAAEGCPLFMVSRDPGRLEAAASEIRARYGVEVQTEAADLSLQPDIDRVAAAAGKIDLLVNNAGAIPNGSIEEMDIHSWRKAWDLKVFGYIALTKAVYPQMKARRSGVILNIIGMAGERPSAWYVMGSTGNASLYTFTQALGTDSFEHGVRVLGLSPGYVETDRQRDKMSLKAEKEFGDPSRWREFTKNLPQARLAAVREISDVALFLLSDRASFITGTTVTVDGGLAGRPITL